MSTEELLEALRQRNPKSGEIWERAQKVYPGGEISAARTFDPYPFYVQRAEGAYLWDIDGNRYLDCCMCYGVHLLGHRPAPVMEALAAQLERDTHYGAPHPLEVEFAEKFVKCAPCAEMILLCNSGFEAVMKAITIARAYTGRDKVAKFEGGFHGAHEYSLWSILLDPELMGPAERPNLVPQAAGLPKAAKDAMLLLPYGEESAFDLIAEHASELAVVMIEPVFGPGTLPADKGFLQKLREVTRRTGVLLLFDEVMTGFRLALGGGQEFYGVVPDIATYGKAIGGGLPIGAVGCSREIMHAVTEMEPPIAVAGTFSGNCLTVAAGNALLDYLMDHPQIYGELAAKGDHLRATFNDFARSRGLPATMTGVGSLFQAHLQPPPVTKPRDLIREDFEARYDFALLLRLNGVFIPAPIHLAFISPAHSDEDMEEIIRAHQITLEACLAARTPQSK
ncbi:MAG: aspartate aminotransferase family protein [Anaerolineae bacterium]|nr:aspartate aminotransferase family protein [Anaerolineae bacterium]